jgi:hypothetical protein
MTLKKGFEEGLAFMALSINTNTVLVGKSEEFIQMAQDRDQ